MAEKFCLKWNDFSFNVSKSFGLFRNEEYLHDVTLVSDDHHQVSAHKLVLSACSEYFKNIFKNNNKPNTQTLLCLDGIGAEDLKNIMDYIYNGEVQIFQDGLDRFLDVAQRMKLEGLMGDNTETEQNGFLEDSTKMEDNSHLEEVEEKVVNRKTNTKILREVVTADKVMVPISSQDIDEVTKTIQQYVETLDDGSVKCTICGKVNTGNDRKKIIRNHIETHLEGLSYPCQLCGKTFRSRNSFTTHKCFRKVKNQ